MEQQPNKNWKEIKLWYILENSQKPDPKIFQKLFYKENKTIQQNSLGM